MDQLNYFELTEKLLRKFTPKRLPGDSLLQLSSSYQRHDENIADFVTRLRLLAAKALEDDLEGALVREVPGIKKKNKDIQLNQFKMGLRKDLMRETGVLLQLKEPNLDLEKAEELVTLQEMNLMIQGKTNSTKVAFIDDIPQCYHCNRTGHRAKDCRSKGSSREQSVPRQKIKECLKCGKRCHWFKECWSNTPQRQNRGEKCLRCGKRGHGTKECW